MEIIKNEFIEMGVSHYGATLLYIKRTSDNKDLIVKIKEENAKKNNWECHGAIVGPAAGRICQEIINFKNQKYKIPKFNKFLLHSGENRIYHNKWNLKTKTANSITFTYEFFNEKLPFLSPQNIKVSYFLNKNELSCFIESSANDEKIMNYTNHTYFSLGEKDSQNILLKGNVVSEIEIKDAIITGKILDLKENHWNFKEYQSYKDIDNPFVINGPIYLKGKNSNIKLKIKSNQKAVVIYNDCYSSMNKKYKGIAIEMQGYPDAINHSNFPQNVFSKRINKISYKFSW